ncbi:sensor histidine kinase [Sagittula salina]|uniref:histidine kinase n=1 Tax=Sagittula salina TaxID=2820268 RepID=A0A940MRX5_9RHOB|nr:HAMP domain-containing sensor histidine kinase [Sagittula salina]MBP0484858.1 HAMP domain-containing histidine kinase [Sagittula salina]
MKDITETEQDFEAFLYIVTHDLKTYARAMRVIPEWIEEDLGDSDITLPEGVAQHMEMLKAYAKGLDRVLEGLTELSRVGRLSDAPAPVALARVFAETWEHLPDREGFSLDLSDCAGTVLGPPNDLGRLAHALLSNPILHHHEGGGRIRLNSSTAGGRVVLTVLDDGPGIEPPYREKVFEPLYCMRPREETGAAGVGLAVARKVVQALGGEIAVIDVPGHNGCCMQLDLPAAL